MSEPRDPDQKKLYSIYALFGVSIALCVLPYMSAAILSAVFLTVLLIAACSLRKKAEPLSLVHNHMVFIIRSLWIAALMSLFTMLAASFYMFQSIDYGAFNPCADTISGQGIEALEAMGYGEFYTIAQPCIDDFIALNYNTLIVAVAIAGGLPLVYLGYRFFKGMSRAVKGYRIADPKSWL